MEFDPFSDNPRTGASAGQIQTKGMTFDDAFNNPTAQKQAQTNIQSAQPVNKQQEISSTKSIVRARPHAKTMPANADFFSFSRFDNDDRSKTNNTDAPGSNVDNNIVDVFASANTNGNNAFTPPGSTNDNPFSFASSNSNPSTDLNEPDNGNVFDEFATSGSNANDTFSPPSSITSKVFITSNQQQSTNVNVCRAQSSFDDSFSPVSNSGDQNKALTSNASSNFTVYERNDQSQVVQKPAESDREVSSGASNAINPQEIIANLAKSGFISETKSTLKTNGSSNSLLGSDNQLQHLEVAKTVHKFIPRHGDEILLDVGDSIEIIERYPDLWCRGKNTRTNKKGVFPICCVAVDTNKQKIKNCIRYLGSVSTQAYKGSEIIIQGTQQLQNAHRYNISGPPVYTMEISEYGIKVAEGLNKKTMQGYASAKKNQKQKFYQLDRITFAGCHPKNDRIFGFITKEMSHTYHCHLFQSDLSAVPIARAIGEAFKIYYQRLQAQRQVNNTPQSQSN